MNQIYNEYLTQIQYNKICKYWKFIDKFLHQLNNFDYENKYRRYDEFLDNEEIIYECIEHNKKLDNLQLEIKNWLKYYYEQYELYLVSIGIRLCDNAQDEVLFNLINNGVILD